ncbi:arylesterase [Aestuariicoccus sp. MJ-SS9]|uniref:arylesterase n=1 Tax=Aestuariicoccus sp. MJ-SS9 TaxID=3079855 RepID=UPI00290F33A1|nr:arylesterase [Aestuariicoccus sp. MJ-SS9]MDU8909939.1 arylesterase [Aestuariicoccus sp. MJ-SS9]
MFRCFTYGARARVSKAALALFLVWGTVAQAEGVQILALGDSLTQGYGLPQPDGFVPQLERWLDGQGIEAEVINGGVSGDTTAGGLSRVEWSLTPEVDAVIVALGGNDLLRGIAPEVSRANLDGILSVAQRNDLPVLLVGVPAPGNYGRDYKAAFDAIYPELSEVYGTLYVRSFFQGLGDDPVAARGFFQDDGIHPNADGVARIVAALGPAVAELVDRADGS